MESLFYTRENKNEELPTHPHDEEPLKDTDFRKVLEESLEKLAEKRSVIGTDQRQKQFQTVFLIQLLDVLLSDVLEHL